MRFSSSSLYVAIKTRSRTPNLLAMTPAFGWAGRPRFFPLVCEDEPLGVPAFSFSLLCIVARARKQRKFPENRTQKLFEPFLNMFECVWMFSLPKFSIQSIHSILPSGNESFLEQFVGFVYWESYSTIRQRFGVRISVLTEFWIRFVHLLECVLSSRTTSRPELVLQNVFFAECVLETELVPPKIQNLFRQVPKEYVLRRMCSHRMLFQQNSF